MARLLRIEVNGGLYHLTPRFREHRAFGHDPNHFLAHFLDRPPTVVVGHDLSLQPKRARQ